MSRTRTPRISIRFFLNIKAIIIWCNKEGHFLLVNAVRLSTTRLNNNSILVLLFKAKIDKLQDNLVCRLLIEEYKILIPFNNKDKDKLWAGIIIYKVKWDLSKIYLIKDSKACKTIWVGRWIRVVNRCNNLSSPNSE